MEHVKKGIWVQVPQAREVLQEALALQFGENQYEWRPEYDEIAVWLANNHSRGLLLMGNFGQGKTVFVRDLLPDILLHQARPALHMHYYRAVEMAVHKEEIMRYAIVVIDDIGVEPVEHLDYGNVSRTLEDILDSVDDRNALIILTTNLNMSEIKERYGERVVERLKALVSPVIFRGKESYRTFKRVNEV